MKRIYQCTVGSRMHGLHTEDSDWDIRYIVQHPLRSVLSPFTSPYKGEEEGESWEVRHFARMLASGNPTCFEVLVTPLYEVTKMAKLVRSLVPLSIDKGRILAAHKGYIDSQIKRYLKKEIGKKESIDRKRILKGTVGSYRVLAQCTQLLLTDSFQPDVRLYSQELYCKLMAIKTMDDTPSEAWCMEHVEALEAGIQELDEVYRSLPQYEKDRTVDINGIENVICELYGVCVNVESNDYSGA